MKRDRTMLVDTAAARKGRLPSAPRGRVTAILLAAGGSSRMGTPKLLLSLRDRPVLAHALDALRRSRVGEIVVVLGAEADRVRGEVSLAGTRVVVNPDYEQGMSASIQAGLRAASPAADAVLIVLGDQPLVSTATIDALVAREEAEGSRVLVPVFAGVRGNPVLLHRSLFAEIETIQGDVGCRQVVAAHEAEVVEVPVDDPGILLDVDTPEDLRRVEAALREGRPLAPLVEHRLRGAPRKDGP